MELNHLQKELESLYQVDVNQSIEDFLVSSKLVENYHLNNNQDQLIFQEADGEFNLGVYLKEENLNNLVQKDFSKLLKGNSLKSFITVIEETSHFIYSLWCIDNVRAFSLLELELQAEIDKFIFLLFILKKSNLFYFRKLFFTLFSNYSFHSFLSAEEIERYEEANKLAFKYSFFLFESFISKNNWAGLISEIRFFYRLAFLSKREYINSLN